MPRKNPPKKPATDLRRRDNTRKRTDEEIAAALVAAYGCVTVAAKRLGITSRAIYFRCEQNPDLRVAQNEAKEALVDLAQNKLAELIESGDNAAVIFTLKTLGRGRGFDERPTSSVNVNVGFAVVDQLKRLHANDDAIGDDFRDAAVERAREDLLAVVPRPDGVGDEGRSV